MLKPPGREEAGLVTELSGEEYCVREDEAREEEEELDHVQQKARPLEPEHVRLEGVDVAAAGYVASEPHELGICDQQQGPVEEDEDPDCPACAHILPVSQCIEGGQTIQYKA